MKDAEEMFKLPQRTQAALDAHYKGFTERPTFVGFPNRKGERDIIDDGATVKMYVNLDRWVGDCPHCNSGITGIVGVNKATCLDCGRRMNVEWPATSDIPAAEVVLEHRPEQNRNWRADRGETVNDLKAENLVRGVPIT